MNVTDRITRGAGQTSIPLTPAENELYRHPGYRLAHFEDGKLVELFDPMDFTNPVHALTDAIAWLKRNTGETWLVLCTGYGMFEPQRLLLADDESLAHLAEVIHQAFADHCH